MATDFGLWIPMQKSLPDDDDPLVWRVNGVASAEEPDRVKETAISKGMDFKPLLDYGWINWDHKSDPEYLIGEPEDARLTVLGDVPNYALKKGQSPDTPCIAVTGLLYKEKPKAQEVYQLMKAFSTGKYNRDLGFSVQGSVAQRRGNYLVKSVCEHLAITYKRAHPSARAALAKSLDSPFQFDGLSDMVKSMQSAEQVESEFDELTRVALGLFPCEKNCNDGTYYRDGSVGMFKHLVECAGWDADIARERVVLLNKVLS